MANALAEEARTMTDAQLGAAINEAYREVFNLQFQIGTRQLQNPMAMGAARRQVARLRTILRERQLAEAAGTPLEPSSRAAVAEEVEDDDNTAESTGPSGDDSASEEA
jgi:large subunit ribosomal protein L29